jgi:hypothetical protein
VLTLAPWTILGLERENIIDALLDALPHMGFPLVRFPWAVSEQYTWRGPAEVHSRQLCSDRTPFLKG